MIQDEAFQQFNLWLDACRANKIDPSDIIATACARGLLGYPEFQHGAPHPVVISNKDQFQKIVREAQKATEEFFANRCDSLPALIKSSVDRSTFRAFPLKASGGKRGPSVVYREYTLGLLESKFNEFQTIKDWETYSKFVESAANGLEKTFDEEVRKPNVTGFARAAKMLNLSFKFALRFDKFSDVDRNRLINFLHVPLDSFTLQGIRTLAGNFKIPRNASMGWASLNNKDIYHGIQGWIKNECELIDCKPIHYEFAAWNIAHSKKVTL